jgi:hypothetical protein
MLEALESRLAEQLSFDDSKQGVLERLLADNEDLRKQNISLEMENRRLQHTLELDNRRHKEGGSDGSSLSDTYDWIVDIQLLSDVSRQVRAARPSLCGQRVLARTAPCVERS